MASDWTVILTCWKQKKKSQSDCFNDLLFWFTWKSQVKVYLPTGVSSSTPTQTPSANCVSPTKRTVPALLLPTVTCAPSVSQLGSTSLWLHLSSSTKISSLSEFSAEVTCLSLDELFSVVPFLWLAELWEGGGAMTAILEPHWGGGEFITSFRSVPCCGGTVGNAVSAATREEDEEEGFRTSDRVTVETLLEK